MLAMNYFLIGMMAVIISIVIFSRTVILFFAAATIGCTIFFIKTWLELKNTVALLTGTKELDCSELLNTAGYRGKFVKLTGKIKPAKDGLLKSPYTNTDCIHYASMTQNKIYKVYEEQESQGTNAHGRPSNFVTVKRSVIEYKTTSFASVTNPFFVTDGKNDIYIDDIKHATVDGKYILFNEVPLVSGKFSSKTYTDEPIGETIIAKKKEEKVLLPNEQVHIAGTFFAGEKGAIIGKDPTDDDSILYAGHRSATEHVEESDAISNWLYAIIGMSAVSLVFLVHGAFGLYNIIKAIFLY